MSRARGPLCASEVGEDWIDPGTLSRTRTDAPSPAGAATLSAEERELFLDLGQMALDLVGVVDPTPVSDGSNALISLGRGDWFGAGISSVSLLPYIGDVAKVGKLGRWAQTVQKAVALARKNARFAERARPALRRIANLLNELPARVLPQAVAPQIVKMKQELASLLGVSTRLGRKALLDQYFKQWSHYIDTLHLPPPGADRGVLWSRVHSGQDIAAKLAQRDGKVTLEMTLSASKFQDRFNLAFAQLKDLLGDSQQVADEIWEHFGRRVWEKASLKYTQGLSGRVTAYVRFRGGRGIEQVSGAYEKAAKTTDPILFDELETVAEAMAQNARITSVQLIDQVTGEVKIMERNMVLKAGGSTH